jgi:transglutaminase-like putative cysteine protease
MSHMIAARSARHAAVVCFIVGSAMGIPAVCAKDAADEPKRETAALTGADPVEAYPIKRRVRYSFTLQNTTAGVLEGPSLTTYAPVRQTSAQRLEKLSASVPAEAIMDPLGNQLLVFRIDQLAPFASKVIQVEAELALADRPVPQPIPPDVQPSFTQPERFVEADDAEIKNLAQALKGPDAKSSARSIYNWVRKNIAALPFTPEDRGARQALRLKAGDCTEQAYLFVAIARAAGVPARVLGGFVMPESGVLDPRDYHNWAEYYFEGSWHLADPEQGRFSEKGSRYVALRIVSSRVPNQLGDNHRYEVTGRGLTVSMR